jgi:outer membrane receptor for ferrienterochelin and colicin
MKYTFLLLAFLIAICNLYAQQTLNISGYIKDAGTSEVLIGVNVIDTINKRACTSNEFGFFSITVPANKNMLVFSYVGYNESTFQLTNYFDTSITIFLTTNNKIDEIVITAGYDRVKSPYMGVETLSAKTIEGLPVVFGEPDITRTLTLLPGVTFGTESTAGYVVRGGSPDQNLILIDGAPIYNPYHLYGFFSVFNSDAINNARLFKGSIPAKFGGCLSSLLDIQMNEGNSQTFSGKIKVGLESSRILLEGPLIKNKTSFLITARRSMLDHYPKFIENLISDFSGMSFVSNGMDLNSYWFYDANVKLNHSFNSGNKLFINYYTTNDDYTNDSRGLKQTMQWGSKVSSIRWNHIFKNNLFSNVTLYNSNYSYLSEKGVFYGENIENPAGLISYSSKINEYSAKFDFDYNLKHYKLKFGGQYLFQVLKPGVNSISTTYENNANAYDTTLSTRYNSHLTTLYLENEFDIIKNTTLNAGIRLNAYKMGHKIYPSAEPRIAIKYIPAKNIALKASYGRMVQHIHMLSDNWSGLPSDIWVPSTKNIKPQVGNQLSLGFDYNIVKESLSFSTETFTKRMSNLIDYKEGTSFSEDKNWENKIEHGTGRSYGCEMVLRKNSGKATGFISYTWVRSFRQFENLNKGREFPYIYDRAHNVNIVLMVKLNKKYSVGADWVFATGAPVTLGKQFVYNFMPYENKIKYYESLNNYRLENFHRLDLSLNYEKPYRLFTFGWSLGIYNVYNRNNPQFLYDGKEGLASSGIVGMLPYFNMSFQF